MKKYLLMLLALALVLSIGCKKEESANTEAAPSITQKCAKYAVAVYKDNELKTWMSNLSKAETVDLISTDIVSDNKGTVKEVATVKLSDDSQGYLETKHLADRSIVFLADTKTYTRNNAGSAVKTTLPAGTIGFVIDEKADWLQIYVGQVDGKWVTQDWVNDGYTTDASYLADAKIYESAIATLAKGDATKAQKDEALKNLDKLSSSTLFAAKAAEKLESYNASQFNYDNVE